MSARVADTGKRIHLTVHAEGAPALLVREPRDPGGWEEVVARNVPSTGFKPLSEDVMRATEQNVCLLSTKLGRLD